MNSITKKGLNGNQLKLIAIIAMTIDHLTWLIWPGTVKVWYVFAIHIIGRLTAPIMWFFISEGCFYTRNIRAYSIRLLINAIISHFAYCFAFGISLSPLEGDFFNRTSVMWSLFLAVVLVSIIRRDDIKEYVKYIAIFAFCVLAFPSDWSSIAVMAPVFMYMNRDNKVKKLLQIPLWTAVYALVYFLCIDKVYGLLQMFTFLSIPLLMLYNGERGSWKGMKWLFYAYYPLHLVVIGILRVLIYGEISLIF